MSSRRQREARRTSSPAPTYVYTPSDDPEPVPKRSPRPKSSQLSQKVPDTLPPAPIPTTSRQRRSSLKAGPPVERVNAEPDPYSRTRRSNEINTPPLPTLVRPSRPSQTTINPQSRAPIAHSNNKSFHSEPHASNDRLKSRSTSAKQSRPEPQGLSRDQVVPPSRAPILPHPQLAPTTRDKSTSHPDIRSNPQPHVHREHSTSFDTPDSTRVPRVSTRTGDRQDSDGGNRAAATPPLRDITPQHPRLDHSKPSRPRPRPKTPQDFDSQPFSGDYPSQYVEQNDREPVLQKQDPSYVPRSTTLAEKRDRQNFEHEPSRPIRTETKRAMIPSHAEIHAQSGRPSNSVPRVSAPNDTTPSERQRPPPPATLTQHHPLASSQQNPSHVVPPSSPASRRKRVPSLEAFNDPRPQDVIRASPSVQKWSRLEGSQVPSKARSVAPVSEQSEVDSAYRSRNDKAPRQGHDSNNRSVNRSRRPVESENHRSAPPISSSATRLDRPSPRVKAAPPVQNTIQPSSIPSTRSTVNPTTHLTRQPPPQNDRVVGHGSSEGTNASGTPINAKEARRRTNALLGLMDGLGLDLGVKGGYQEAEIEYEEEEQYTASHFVPEPDLHDNPQDDSQNPHSQWDTSSSKASLPDSFSSFEYELAHPAVPPPTPSPPEPSRRRAHWSDSHHPDEESNYSRSQSEDHGTPPFHPEFDTDESEPLCTPSFAGDNNVIWDDPADVVYSRSSTPDSATYGSQALFMALEHPCHEIGDKNGDGTRQAGSDDVDKSRVDADEWEGSDDGQVDYVQPDRNTECSSSLASIPDETETRSPRRPRGQDADPFKAFTFPRQQSSQLQHTSQHRDSPSLLPIPQPTIVIQPSTSSSSADGGVAHYRAVSADSISSYSDSILEHEEEGEQFTHEGGHVLSSAAEKLFQSVGPSAELSVASSQVPDHPPRLVTAQPHAPPMPSPHTTPRCDMTPTPQSKTWRSTLSPDAYQSLFDKHGAFELRRQEVIWELCNTEQSFVQSLRVILRLFVQPLRANNQNRWIPGIPKDVTRLFDWLDDIIQLHSHISSALLGVRSSQYPVVLQVAEVLRPFVPRLELHQPYLVRLESVSRAIDEMIKDESNDFGEFLRMQTASPECGSMSLTSFLLKPVQRLMKYPLFFKQLWDLTPRNHPDYLPTFSLMHSTEIVIKVMNEVKAREDEYDLVKSLAERIKGLPVGFQLARRERRLIAQGFLKRVVVSEKDQDAMDSLVSRGTRDSTIKAPDFPNAQVPMGTPPVPLQSPVPPSPIPPYLSKLMPITSPQFMQPRGTDWFSSPSSPYIAQFRPDSTSSDSSLISTFSAAPFDTHSSDGTRSTTSSVFGMTASGTEFSLRPDSVASSAWADPQEGVYNLPFSLSPRLPGRSPSLRSSSRRREVQVYAFVFSDFVLLATPVVEHHLLRSPRGNDKKECWKVLEEVGMSRVLGVSDQSGNLNQEHLISLDLLPMTPGRRGESLFDTSPAIHVYLSLPERVSSRMAVAPLHVLDEARNKWLDAFQRCFQHTLRALSFPSSNGRHLTDGSHLDFDLNARKSVMSILSSGLPLPKSPSQQIIDEIEEGRNGDPVEQEREERGWWSMLFHQVMREMERNDGRMFQSNKFILGGGAPLQRSPLARTNEMKRVSINGPRPLLLGSQSNGTGAGDERKGLLRSFSKKGR